MTRIIGWVFLFGLTLAAAENAPPIRICIAPLENHSIYQLPVDKLQSDLVSQLSHKHIRAVSITGQDLSDAMAKNSCEYLLHGEFSNFAIPRGEPICGKCPVVDERKHFALQFGFYLKKTPSKDPVYSHEGAVIDKNPKTCADDHIWETVQFIRGYLKSVARPTD